MPKRLEGDFDYVIVGGGTAGCVLANRLSADPDGVAAGGGRQRRLIWIHIPVGYLYASATRAPTGVRDRAGNRVQRPLAPLCPRPVLGGCSSINAMIYMRGQPRLRRWASRVGGLVMGQRPARCSNGSKTSGRRSRSTAPAVTGVEQQRLRWEVLDASAKPRWKRASRRPRFQSRRQHWQRIFRGQPAAGIRWNAAQGF